MSSNLPPNLLFDEDSLKHESQSHPEHEQIYDPNLPSNKVSFQERQFDFSARAQDIWSTANHKENENRKTPPREPMFHPVYPQTHLKGGPNEKNDTQTFQTYHSAFPPIECLSTSFAKCSVQPNSHAHGYTQGIFQQQRWFPHSPVRENRISMSKQTIYRNQFTQSVDGRQQTSPISSQSASPISKIHSHKHQHVTHSILQSSTSLPPHNDNRAQCSQPQYNLQSCSTNNQHRRYTNSHSTGCGQSGIQRDVSQSLPLHVVSSLPHIRHHSFASSPHSPAGPSGSGRSPPEVLKTLLRKKACLYEPATSRAIALITWLVGRSLALRHGYFSRQHLQAGVHNVVGSKIDAEIITRTKVNRCMQIILNSCFHYIIPRPDGKEEKGDTFQKNFADTVIDDTHLLKSLPSPWHDLELNFKSLVETDINATAWTNKDEEEHEPNQVTFIKKDAVGKDDNVVSTRRPVLLCFNENVRTAEDVLRCHNEFIRDTAISARLLLSADEWRVFFAAKDDDDGSHSQITDGTAESTLSGGGIMNSPLIRASDGCDIPYISFEIPSDVSDLLTFKEHVPQLWAKKSDSLGQMNPLELAKFRTTWCCKRYDHDSALCRFAHANINMGWLRRDPMLFEYSDEMCPHTNIVREKSILNECHLNACANGVTCKFSHSKEEVDYHPKVYKMCVCESGNRFSVFNCKLRDICPLLHPDDHNQFFFPVRARSPSQHSVKQHSESHSRTKIVHSINVKYPEVDSSTIIPGGAPILYLSPAPESYFDRSLLLPGMRGLYRRNCASHYAYRCGFSQHECSYSIFGDDWGLPLVNVTFSNYDKRYFSLHSM